MRLAFRATLAAVWLAGAAAAHEPHTPAQQAAPASDAQAVEQAIKKLFDKPEAPLRVAPISVEGSWAVAGWTQGQRGGRAVLKKDGGRWSIQVCGGDGLRTGTALAQLGIDSAGAERLARKVKAAEAALPAAQVRMFSLFEGTVRVDAGHAHPH
jgi:hypothetical protein